MVAQEKYEYQMTSKGPELKLDYDIKLVEHIERKIVIEKKSPEVVSKQLKEYGFNMEISGRTIRNAIKSGLIFNKVKQGKIIHKKEYDNKNKDKRVSKMIPMEKNIEYRPKEALLRNVYGYWEGNLVVGKQGTKTVAKALDKLERRYGSKFYKIFKSITFDNGVEFMGYKGLEKSCLRKKKEQQYIMHIRIAQAKEKQMKIIID